MGHNMYIYVHTYTHTHTQSGSEDWANWIRPITQAGRGWGGEGGGHVR